MTGQLVPQLPESPSSRKAGIEIKNLPEKNLSLDVAFLTEGGD